MNITVAKRIIGGFTTISVLLFIISITSLYNLSSINNASDEVIDLAIPTLVKSDQLKIHLSDVSTLIFRGYYENNEETLSGLKQEFEKIESAFQQELSALKQVVRNEPELKRESNNLDALNQAFFQLVESIFQNKKDILELNRSIEDRIGEIEDAVDNTSTLILDFNDSDEVSKNSALRAAAKSGENLDDNLMSVVAASENFLLTQSNSRAETLGNEVKLLIDQIKQHSADMEEKSNGQDDTGSIEDIGSELETLYEEVTGSNGIINLHNQRLSLKTRTASDMQDAIAKMETTSQQLDKVLLLGNQKADTIKKDVASTVSSSKISTIFITIISIVAAVGIGVLTVRKITVPLSKVNGLLNIVATGDLTHSLNADSKDEFGELARNCNALINNLKALISGISSGATQLAAAAEETSSVTHQTTRSIEEQKSQVSQAATATTELNSTAQLVANSADDTLSQISNANKEAETVRTISEENKQTILVLAKDVDSAADVINKVHQDSASIGGILDVIRGIADQTNLLALNAAIEAARAGEQGRGFAVVADEVRTLASRTQESTQEIQSMIEVLQAGAEQAVSVMQKGKEQTSLCVTQAEKAAEALNSITSAVHKAHDVSTQIEQAAREQNTVSRDISEKLENIVEIAEETASGAAHTSRASQEVAALAEELQSSVRKFQV